MRFIASCWLRYTVQFHQHGNLSITVADYVIAIRQQEATLRINGAAISSSIQLEPSAPHEVLRHVLSVVRLNVEISTAIAVVRLSRWISWKLQGGDGGDPY